MIKEILLCGVIQVFNSSGQPWNDGDYRVMELAMEGCKKKFKKSPCLVKFVKKPAINKKDVHYNAHCGAEQGTKTYYEETND